MASWHKKSIVLNKAALRGHCCPVCENRLRLTTVVGTIYEFLWTCDDCGLSIDYEGRVTHKIPTKKEALSYGTRPVVLQPVSPSYNPSGQTLQTLQKDHT